MGFEIPRRTAVLTFEDPEYEGCEVRCLFDISMGDLLYFDNLDAESTKAEEAMRRFGDAFLESWNVEVDGEPVPATGDGIMAVPAPFALMLLNAWRKAMSEMAGVDGPLVEPSPNGKQVKPRSRRKSRAGSSSTSSASATDSRPA